MFEYFLHREVIFICIFYRYIPKAEAATQVAAVRSVFYSGVLAFSFTLFVAAPRKLQPLPRDYGRDDEPDCRESYQRVDDNRPDSSRTLKYPADEVEVEDAVQPPIERADNYENVRNKICNYHFLISLTQSILNFEAIIHAHPR